MLKIDAKAIEALQKIGPPAIPSALKALTHDRWQVRAGAAHALGLYGPEATRAVPALAAAVTDSHGSVRRLAADALAQIGAEAKTAIPVLQQGLTHQNVRIRISVAYALARTDPGSDPAYQALVEALQYVDRPFWNAIGGWQEKYARADEVQKNGRRYLNDERAVRALAAQTLGELGPAASRTLPALIMSLGSGNSEAAAFAIGRLGPAGAPAVPALIEQLLILQTPRGWNEYAFSRICWALGQIGYDATHLNPILQVLKTTGEQRYFAIADAFTGAPVDAVPELIGLLAADDPMVASRAAYALGKMGARAKSAVPALVDALRQNRTYVQTAAAVGLRGVGVADRRVISALRDRLGDDDQAVRSAAANALWVLDPRQRPDRPSR